MLLSDEITFKSNIVRTQGCFRAHLKIRTPHSLALFMRGCHQFKRRLFHFTCAHVLTLWVAQQKQLKQNILDKKAKECRAGRGTVGKWGDESVWGVKGGAGASLSGWTRLCCLSAETSLHIKPLQTDHHQWHFSVVTFHSLSFLPACLGTVLQRHFQ